MNALSVDGLTKAYKRGFIPRPVQVLKGLRFSVPQGSITGFLGANGAGKTTTMRCVLGLDHHDGGEIKFFGEPLSVQSRSRIGFLPERPYFYEYLTGIEFLEFYAQLTRSWNRTQLRDRILQLLRRVDLEFAKDRSLRTYSKGMLQKIGLAQCLIHDPELVILDEPMSGLDPDGRMALAEIILEIARKGTAVFFTSHLLHDTERLCNRLIVLRDGSTIYEGSTEELLSRGGGDFEVTYLASGRQQKQKAADEQKLQGLLKQLLSEGATVTEVRRLRPSLEEVFVRMALRGEGAKS